MKYYILHDFKTSTLFKEKSSDNFKDVHKLLANFDVNLTSAFRRSYIQIVIKTFHSVASVYEDL